jgi:hypothetical protein
VGAARPAPIDACIGLRQCGASLLRAAQNKSVTAQRPHKRKAYKTHVFLSYSYRLALSRREADASMMRRPITADRAPVTKFKGKF